VLDGRFLESRFLPPADASDGRVESQQNCINHVRTL
jgi:hypothetical protein